MGTKNEYKIWINHNHTDEQNTMETNGQKYKWSTVQCYFVHL